MAKGDRYIKHDYHAHEDDKIAELVERHGLAGYGTYWYLLELMTSGTDYSVPDNNSTIRRITYGDCEHGIDGAKIIDDMVVIGLIERENGRLYSTRLREQCEELDAASAALSAAGRKGGRPKKAKVDTNCENQESHPLSYPFGNEKATLKGMVSQIEKPPFKQEEKRKEENTTSTTEQKSEEKTEEPPYLVDDVVVNLDWKRVCDAYMSQLGTLPLGRACEMLQSYVDDLGADAVIAAIESTNAAQPANPWAWLKKILDAFAQGGVHSKADALAMLNDHEARKRASAAPKAALASAPPDPYAGKKIVW